MNETSVNVNDIDLSRHAVVEASAGTGKTYTIERLVQRLLLETNVSIDQILVVTFTEKATGELKVRLRTALERAARENAEDAERLKPALDHFDQAPIHTIHGFCHRLLQDFALEQGQDFAAQRADDVDLLKRLLREIQRKDWRREFGDQLKPILEGAGFDREYSENWDRKVLEIAKRYQPRAGHQLRPAFQEEWWRRLADADANPAGQLDVFTIARLRQRLREVKRQQGSVSYDDMIALVEESLDPTLNRDADSFLAELRQRFRYGIVDEFQDTDPLQWRIFRRIFLEGGESKLFVVGDPKQAIFGFRGADLPTYQRATDEMKAEFAAREYPLVENWRSEQDLLDGLNCIFGDGAWFPREERIPYRPVHAPDDDRKQTRTLDDRTNRAAVSLVDVTHVDKAKQAHRHFARFTAFEIDRLLRGNGGPLFSFTLKNGPERHLTANDICILVATRNDAEPITQALDAAQIPFSFYKQSGLWKSDEAEQVQMLLVALAQPEERSSFAKALLTCFFRVSAVALAQGPDVPAQHPARRLWQDWLGYAENREWSGLFRSLLEDTGLLFVQDDGTADRRLANLRQILATLEQIGHGFNHDLLGLLDWMRERRAQNDSGESEMQPDESGRPKVKIMTMHASKGLEFPVVFLGGGFTQAQNPGKYAVYHDDAGRLILDITAETDGLESVKSERLSEQRRLLYVALTRAIFKLYLPKIVVKRKGAWLGPVGTILLPALTQSCPERLGPLVVDVVKPPVGGWIAPPRAETATANPDRPPITLNGPLFPTFDADLGKRRIVVRSFSGLAKHHLSQVGEGSSFGEQTKLVEDEAPAMPDREDPLRGPVFGDMVHNVIEHIDFAEVARADSPAELHRAGSHARKLIDREIRANIGGLRSRVPLEQLADACRAQIATLIWQTLRTPLTELGARLCDIPEQDRLHELDFLFPDARGEFPEEGFVSGYMDLLLRKDGRFFLLDWKTNLLAGYSPEQIERGMSESDYHRQYRLYLNAARRWLERTQGTGFSFFKRLGGVYYLFVRGMNGRDETTGVFFRRPTEAELWLGALLH